MIGETACENMNLASVEISITQTLIREDENLKKPFTIYVIEINLDGENWTVQRKYKEFCSLNEKLMNYYPNVRFPSATSQFCNKSLCDIVKKKKTAVVEDRRKILQKYLNGLAQIPSIRDSEFFKEFLGVNPTSAKPVLEEISSQNIIFKKKSDNIEPKVISSHRPKSDYFS